MFPIISFFQKLIKGGWNKSGGSENFSKVNMRGGGRYPEKASKSTLKPTKASKNVAPLQWSHDNDYFGTETNNERYQLIGNATSFIIEEGMHFSS